MKILIIEDQERRFRRVTERLKDFLMKTNSGYDLVVKDDWREGVEYYQRDPDQIELVILDMRMPRSVVDETETTMSDKHTGSNVYSIMKNRKQNQKFIFWTVLSQHELMEEGIDANDGNYSDKLNSFTQLFSKIDVLIGTKLTEYIENNYSVE